MRKYGSSGSHIAIDRNGEPQPIQRTASRPLNDDDVTRIETEDGPAVSEPEE